MSEANQLKPGPGLDHVIAYEMMPPGYRDRTDWHPSSNVAHAWEVVTSLQKRNLNVVIAVRDDGRCGVHITGRQGGKSAEADSMPMAVCLAVLEWAKR